MRTATKSQVTPSIQSLDRGLLILEAVGKSGSPVSLGELTELLGIDRSSGEYAETEGFSFLPGRAARLHPGPSDLASLAPL